MKIIFIILIAFQALLVSAQTQYELTNIGNAEYKKFFSNKRAFQVYNKGRDKVIYILPRNLYGFCGVTNTLEFTINKIDGFYSIDINDSLTPFNCSYIDNYLIFKDKEDQKSILKFKIDFLKKPKDIVVTPIKDDVLEKDTSIGFISFENTLLRYSQIVDGDLTFNVAINDKNKNGMIDSLDMFALSFDTYFMTRTSNKASHLKKKTLIKVKNKAYTLNWSNGYNISLQESIKTSGFEMVLSDTLPNLVLANSVHLREIIAQNDITIISVWSIYCPPCIRAIKKLNNFNTNIIGLHLEEEIPLKKYNTNYPNYHITRKDLNTLNINGYPHYIVVSKNMFVVDVFKDINSLILKYK